MTLTATMRQPRILEVIEQRGWLSVGEISREFDVSPVTARQDRPEPQAKGSTDGLTPRLDRSRRATELLDHVEFCEPAAAPDRV